MIPSTLFNMLNMSGTMRKLKRLLLALLVLLILVATNPSLDEFKAYAALQSENPHNVTAARTSYWFLFSIYESSNYDQQSTEWDQHKSYVGVLNNFIQVGSR